MDIEGRIKLIYDTQTFASGFQKREFVITTKEQYPQDVKFELTKEIIGDRVDISEIKNTSSENIISNLFHLTLLGDLVSVYMAENLHIDPYDITTIEKLKKLLKG